MPEHAREPAAPEATPGREPAVVPLAAGGSPGAVLALQRTAGNRATRSVVARRALARVPAAAPDLTGLSWLAWSLIRAWRTGTVPVPGVVELLAGAGQDAASALLELGAVAADIATRKAAASAGQGADRAAQLEDVGFAESLLADVRGELLVTASAAERLQVILRTLRPDAYQGDWGLSAAAEQLIVDVIALAPSSQSATLVELLTQDGHALLKRLDSALDGQANADLWLAAGPHLLRGSLQRRLPVSQDGDLEVPTIPWAGASSRYDYDVSWAEHGAALHVRVRRSETVISSDVPERTVVYDGVLAPDAVVGVRFEKADAELRVKAGQTLFVPAVALHLFVHRADRAERIRLLQIAALIGSAGAFAAAEGVAAVLLAAVELAVAAAAPVVERFREEIASTEQGRTFLRLFDFVQTAIAIVGLARLVGVPKLLRRLTDAAFKLPNAGAFTNTEYKAVNDSLGRVRIALNDADRAALGAVPRTGGADALLGAEEIEAGAAGLEREGAAIGKGLREANVRLDVDEPLAVSKGGAWDTAENKRFLERLTNQITKNDLTEYAPSPAPRRISLAQAEADGPIAFRAAAKEMLVRSFSEVEELERITQEARGAMTSTDRPVGVLRNAINKSIRSRIRAGATPDAARVGRALRAAGVDPETLATMPEPQLRVAIDPPARVAVPPQEPPAAPVPELEPEPPSEAPARRQMRLPQP